MGSLSDVAVTDVLGFLDEALPLPPSRVLEVGCGQGALAAALLDRGYRVTGVEPDPEAAEAARGKGVPVETVDLLGHRDRPYDAVVFTRSLHHIASPETAVEHALGLLAPGGSLVLDEFCRERADRRAAAFFYDLRGLLYACGLAAAHDHGDGGHGEQARDPLERWHCELPPADDHPLHTGEQVRSAVAARTDIAYAAHVPYMWRHILDTSTSGDEPWTGRAAIYLREVERRRISEDSLPAIGLRLAARAASA